MTVQTLQQHLESIAEFRAKRDAGNIVGGIPLASNAVVEGIWLMAGGSAGMANGKGCTTFYHLMEPLREALFQQLRDQYLKEETENLLSAVNKVRDITAGRESDE